MADKRRLEEIKSRIKSGFGCLRYFLRDALDPNDKCVVEDIKLLENDIVYLIKQAERVRELEVWYHSYHKEAKLNNILKIQNKRYREALDKQFKEFWEACVKVVGEDTAYSIVAEMPKEESK